MAARSLGEVDDFDPYHKWLGIPKDKRPPTLYQLLGISPTESDVEVISAAVDRQQAFVTQFQGGPHHDAAASILLKLEEARIVLLNSAERRKYDQKLQEARQHLRRKPERTTVLFGSGSQSIGEDDSTIRQLIGIVAIICVAFGGMAIFAFNVLPWSKQPGVQPKDVGVPGPAVMPLQPNGAQPRQNAKKVPPENLPAEEPRQDPATTRKTAKGADSLVNVPLSNHSFENDLEAAWKVQTFVPLSEQAKIVTNQAKDGSRSLMLEAVKPDDIRCSQTVEVKPNTRYRLTGWVKTSSVKVVQKDGQEGAILSVFDVGNSSSLIGNHDWTELNFEFATGPRKQIELGPRLGYFGSTCIGTAWFDDIRLFEIIGRSE